MTLRMIAWLLLAVPALPASSQLAAVSQTTYISTDGSFRFSYPVDFQVCTAGNIEPCLAHFTIPACGQDAIICVVHPGRGTKGTNFGAAAFQVRKVQTPPETMTPNGCISPDSDDTAYFSASNSIAAKNPEETIGGLQFAHRVGGGAAAGSSNSVDAYRIFHEASCYELSVTESQVDASRFDTAYKPLPPVTKKEIEKSLSEVLHSFRFQK